ncbi:MAG: hypothetical protein ABFC34_15285 [Methanobacterium sp.]
MSPEDFEYISKTHKKIILFDFFNLSQKDEINSFIRSVLGKDLVYVNENKSKETVQWSVNSIPFEIKLPKYVSSIQIYSGYFFGDYFTLIFECNLNIKDNNEISPCIGKSLEERFQLFEAIHSEIENLLPRQFQGFFFKNEMEFEEKKLKLPSMYIYDVNDYKFIFEDNSKDNVYLASLFRTTLKDKVDDFFIKESKEYEDSAGFNPLLFLGIEPKVIFSLISDKLICFQSNSYFEGSLRSVSSNYIILDFEKDKKDQLLNFALEFVLRFYLNIIFEKLLIDLSNVKVPEIRQLEKEILEAKKAEILRTKIKLDEVNDYVFSYSRIFDSLSAEDLSFSNEEIRSYILAGNCADHDSISQYFSDHISGNKKEIDKIQVYLKERISDVSNWIISELNLIKNKPKVSGFYKEIESALIIQIKRWEGTPISQEKIEAWLSNFDNNKDRIIALNLLDKLKYITNQNLKPFIRSSYNLLLSFLNADDLANCNISSIGGLTSGSTHLAKLFEEENRIEKKHFRSFESLKSLTKENGKKDTLILIDDFIGSGNYYVKWYDDNHDLLDSFLQVIYMSLIGLKKGIINIEQRNKTKVLVADILDADQQVIDGTLFDPKEKQEIRELLEKYSLRISSEYIYGYDNCQLLLAFEDNIPNNTLGIFWKSKKWIPLIERK